MKKIISVLLVLVLSIALVACGTTTKTETAQASASAPAETKQDAAATTEKSETAAKPVEVKNPIEEKASLEEINQALNVHLVSIGVMGKSDEQFSIINGTLGQYTFKVNGMEYMTRASHEVDQDISGMYDMEKSSLGNYPYAKCLYYSDEYKSMHYFYNDVQYIFTVNDNNTLDWMNFESQADEFFYNIYSEDADAAVLELCGEYADSVSQRAYMEVYPIAKDAVMMDIVWSSSASEADVWQIPASFTDGKWVYAESNHQRTIKDGSETEDVDDLSGYFEIDEDQNICWTGSQDEGCQGCIFSRVDAF